MHTRIQRANWSGDNQNILSRNKVKQKGECAKLFKRILKSLVWMQVSLIYGYLDFQAKPGFNSAYTRLDLRFKGNESEFMSHGNIKVPCVSGWQTTHSVVFIIFTKITTQLLPAITFSFFPSFFLTGQTEEEEGWRPFPLCTHMLSEHMGKVKHFEVRITNAVVSGGSASFRSLGGYRVVQGEPPSKFYMLQASAMHAELLFFLWGPGVFSKTGPFRISPPPSLKADLDAHSPYMDVY